MGAARHLNSKIHLTEGNMKSTKLVVVLMVVLLLLLVAVPMVSAAPEGKGKGGRVTSTDSTSDGGLDLSVDGSDLHKTVCYDSLCWGIK